MYKRFDVSTASFVDSFSISGQENVPDDIAFSNHGTKMFVVGRGGRDVNEYTLSSPFSLVNVSGEHTGDVMDTSSSSNTDSDADGDTITVTQIRKSGGTDSAVSSSSSYDSNGTSVTGTYGTLTIGADGSYTYAADQSLSLIHI